MPTRALWLQSGWTRTLSPAPAPGCALRLLTRLMVPSGQVKIVLLPELVSRPNRVLTPRRLSHIC